MALVDAYDETFFKDDEKNDQLFQQSPFDKLIDIGKLKSNTVFYTEDNF